jgi:hypothetical protein
VESLVTGQDPNEWLQPSVAYADGSDRGPSRYTKRLPAEWPYCRILG